MISLEEAELKLTEAIELAISKGWKICSGLNFSSVHKMCCAFGALLVDRNDNIKSINKAGINIGLDVNQIDLIIYGFDFRYITLSSVWGKLGQRLAQKYVDGQK